MAAQSSEVAPGLVVQRDDDGHWVIFTSDGRSGAINVEATVKSRIVHSAIVWWIDSWLEGQA